MSTSVAERETPPESGGSRRRIRGPLVVLALLAGALLAILLYRDSGRPPAPGAGRGLVLHGRAAWAVTALGVVAGLGLLAAGLRRRSSWHYPDEPGRDLRIDLLRGLAIVFVVLNHINIASLFQLLSQESVGVVSGAELFVTMSGVVVGMVYRPRVERAGLVPTTGALWRRAGTLYRTALVVVLTAYLVTLLPGVDGRVITTFRDSIGKAYDVYPNIARLLDYPVPGYVVRDILLLRLGPFQFNVLGLYVILLAAAPMLLALLRRRLVLVLLAISWALYLLNTFQPTSLLHSQFEDPFPLLTWQVLFVHGLAAGWYRTELLGWTRRPTGRAVVALLVVGHLGMLFFTWNNPYLSNAYDVRLALIPDATFRSVYQHWFERTTLQGGRLLDTGLLLVTLYALLTAYWKPLHRAVGWFLVPLGQASLYVFVLHVYVALLVANVPGLDGRNVALGTLAHAGVLLLLWLMVRKRFLFSVVPR